MIHIKKSVQFLITFSILNKGFKTESIICKREALSSEASLFLNKDRAAESLCEIRMFN